MGRKKLIDYLFEYIGDCVVIERSGFVPSNLGAHDCAACAAFTET